MVKRNSSCRKKNQWKPLQICIAALFTLVLLAACGPAVSPNPNLTPLTVQLKWNHQAQFAGFYAAEQNGNYAAEGIAVTFIEGGPQVDILASVLAGKAQFGVAGADQLMLARAEGKLLKAIATIYRRSPTVYFAKTDSGISRPQDLAGKTIRVTPPSVPIFRAMMTRVNVPPHQYTIDTTASLDAFFDGTVQASGGYVTNEVLLAQARGLNLNLIFPDDYGIHFYSDTIFATDEFIANNPELVTRFLRATLKGWTFAVENPAAVASMVAKHKPAANLTHELAFMTASLPLINTGEDHIGWMQPEIWHGMEKTLREQNVLTQPLELSQLYTLQFVEEIYKP